MVKLRDPYHSGQLSGKIGDTVHFSTKAGHIARISTIGSRASSSAQLTHRGLFLKAVRHWSTVTQILRDRYHPSRTGHLDFRSAPGGTILTGFNLWVLIQFHRLSHQLPFTSLPPRIVTVSAPKAFLLTPIPPDVDIHWTIGAPPPTSHDIVDVFRFGPHPLARKPQLDHALLIAWLPNTHEMYVDTPPARGTYTYWARPSRRDWARFYPAICLGQVTIP